MRLLGEKAGDIPGRRVGALKAAKGDEGGFGPDSVDFTVIIENESSRPNVDDESWRDEL